MSFLKNFWRHSSKHKKLSEEWALAINNKDIENEFSESNDDLTTNEERESIFNLKYIGSTLVENATNENTTAEAIKTILRIAKQNGKKLSKVIVKVSLKGIIINDETSNKDNDISIFRISYCSADAAHSHVFAFIAANNNDTTMECHAFLCAKRKQAQAVTLAVARSFSMAYEAWRILPNSTSKKPEQRDKIDQINKLIDLEDFEISSNDAHKNQWVSFDEDDTQRFFPNNRDLIYS